ncbi:MAG: GNAT family N-acetyltransferase [Bifidobacteriaceae bacterium]|jgi:phosphinothricin acetyltransferase|nr:GNAT family N-acetyltransferase [Bifidobacteriaceae bacterium]
MHIRPLLPGDWDDIFEIAGEAVGLGALDDELTTWDSWNARFIPGQRLVAASREGRIAGWAALERVSSRPSWSGVAAVSVYVAASFRGQGFGSRLLGGLVAASEETAYWTLQAHVLPHNAAALRLLEHFGFARVGVRRRVFQTDGVWQDAILLDRRSAVVFPEATPTPQEIPEAS